MFSVEQVVAVPRVVKGIPGGGRRWGEIVQKIRGDVARETGGHDFVKEPGDKQGF